MSNHDGFTKKIFIVNSFESTHEFGIPTPDIIAVLADIQKWFTCCRRGFRIDELCQPTYAATPTMLSKNDPLRCQSY